MTSIAPPICVNCVHRIGILLDPKCKAFPGGIPDEILYSRVDHSRPYPGDHGLQFSPRAGTPPEDTAR